MPPPLRLVVGVAARAPATPQRLPPSSSAAASLRCRCRRSSWFSNAEPGDDSANTNTRRRWWSDELEDEYEFDHDGGGVFGGDGELFDEPWFSKVFKTYGYVLPVALASMLVATGPNAFLMAMAIPLAQTAVSFALGPSGATGSSNKMMMIFPITATTSSTRPPRIVGVAAPNSHGYKNQNKHQKQLPAAAPKLGAAASEDGMSSTATTTGAAGQQQGLALEDIPRWVLML